jgi:outer membrane biosynthesis protein TonB
MGLSPQGDKLFYIYIMNRIFSLRFLSLVLLFNLCTRVLAAADLTFYQEKGKKTVETKQADPKETQVKPSQPEIKQVPKAKKQPKPASVKPKVQPQKVKIVKPNIKKR